jgi:hypothetical protein
VLEADDPRLHHHQVDRPVAHDLIGDVEPVAPGIRDRSGHGATIADPELRAELAKNLGE